MNRARSATTLLIATGAVFPSALSPMTADRVASANAQLTLIAAAGERGALAPSTGSQLLIRARDGSPTHVVSHKLAYSVAPGHSFHQWTQTDARGPVRVSLLVADLEEPTLRLRYVTMDWVRQRAVLTTMLARSSAVAGVRWGTAAGYHLVDNERPSYRGVDGALRRDVRQVVVRDQRVVSNTRTLTHGIPVVGQLLVGRGRGATALRNLKVGQRVRFTWSVEGDPTLAVSGSERLLVRGAVTVTDDGAPAGWLGRPGQLHARTAVGIDRDAGNLLLLVVDGR